MATSSINLLSVTNIQALNTAVAALTTTAIDALQGEASTIKQIDSLYIGALTTAGGSVTVTATLSGVVCPLVTSLDVTGKGAQIVIDDVSKINLVGTADKLTLSAATGSTLSAAVNFHRLS
jgi:hypothetical protein